MDSYYALVQKEQEDRNKPKTVNIKFLGLDGKEYSTPVTLNWATVGHNSTIDICQLQEDLSKRPEKIEQRIVR